MLLGIRGIEESSVYQAILKKGIAEGRTEMAREILIHLGSKKFGPPRKQARARIEGLEDLGRLEALTDRIFDVASWDELLGPSG